MLTTVSEILKVQVRNNSSEDNAVREVRDSVNDRMIGGRTSILSASVMATFVAGTLDIGYALGVHAVIGIAPATILQAIASGLLGRDAYQGGLGAAAIGLALHYGLMLITSVGYVVAASWFTAINERPMFNGSLYGLLVFAAMNYVIVPLSAAVPGNPPAGWLMVGALFAHIALVGIPIAVIARRFRCREP